MKSKRVYSVSSSPVLIVLELLLLAQVFMQTRLGVIMLLPGLLLTLLGFFWPNVDVKNQKWREERGTQTWQLKTQQRSEHRISGLKKPGDLDDGSIQRITSEWIG